jgi:hypothetical protein
MEQHWPDWGGYRGADQTLRKPLGWKALPRTFSGTGLMNPRPLDLFQRQNTLSSERRIAARSASFFFGEAPTSSG